MQFTNRCQTAVQCQYVSDISIFMQAAIITDHTWNRRGNTIQILHLNKTRWVETHSGVWRLFMGVQRSGLVRGSRCSSWGYSEHTLKEQFIEKWSYYIPTPVQMKKRLTPVVIKTFLELHRRQSTEAQGNGVIWCLFSGLCFRFIKQVPNYFSCWGESCNSVLLWSPRNV